MGVFMEITIFKGYYNGKEVWAVSKKYGKEDYETTFTCPIEPTPEIRAEYERQKNVCNNTQKAKK